MLSILFPEVLAVICDYPVGLMPLWLPDERPKLVVKASKEYLLAAELNGGFKVYVVSISITGTQTIGLISAFFDDEDEPLIIRTTLFEDDGCCKASRELLLCRNVDVHLFDEHCRELLGFEAEVQHVPVTHDLLASAAFASFDFASARSADDQLVCWFGVRSQNDDLVASSIIFGKRLIPKDLFRIEEQPETHRYHGSEPTSFTELVRKEPGPFQERDIVQLLHRVFFPHQIFLNPLRVTDREEVADILVVTESRVIFIQAKDSPNTEGILRNAISRKKAATERALSKALDQVRGAVRYAKSASPMKIVIGNQEFKIDLAGKELRALIVAKELLRIGTRITVSSSFRSPKSSDSPVLPLITTIW